MIKEAYAIHRAYFISHPGESDVEHTLNWLSTKFAQPYTGLETELEFITLSNCRAVFLGPADGSLY